MQAPFAMPAIAVLVFPQCPFVVTNFGAVAGGDISEAIRQAIAACHDAGGGSVVIPRGRWLTGRILFQCNVNLHLAEKDEMMAAVQTEFSRKQNSVRCRLANFVSTIGRLAALF